MKATITLLNQGHTLDTFTLDYQQLTKSFIESRLISQYGLENGYQISYIDGDGDEIAVEFDDDYEVAKLTHDDQPLTLNVHLNDQNWMSLKRSDEDDETLNIEKIRKIQSLLLAKQKTQPLTEELSKPLQLFQAAQTDKIDPSLLQPLIQHTIIDLQIVQQINQTKPYDEIIMIPTYAEETQPLIEKSLPNQQKRTQTQTSELQSLDQSSHVKAPKKKPSLNFVQDGVPFVQEQSENQKPQIIEPKIPAKPKEKKIKQKNPKLSKKPKPFTEKDIKKLVKKEVFKLLPQIASKLKSTNEVHDSSQPEISEIVTQAKTEQNSDIMKCTVCAQVLTIPFYVNSSEDIRMCQNCQETDESTYPLIKIRNQTLLSQLEWAQPLFYTMKQAKREEMADSKFYGEVKKQFVETIKNQFDARIKLAKENAQRQKQEKKVKVKVEKSKKQKKETKQESLI